MEITSSIQISFNFPKVIRVDNDDLEYGSILKPGNYNITVTPGIATNFYCILPPGHQIKSVFYNDVAVPFYDSEYGILFTLTPEEEGLIGHIEIEGESTQNGCEIYDLNKLSLQDGLNNIFVKFRNHAFLDSTSSLSLSYNNITDLQGTT